MCEGQKCHSRIVSVLMPLAAFLANSGIPFWNSYLLMQVESAKNTQNLICISVPGGINIALTEWLVGLPKFRKGNWRKVWQDLHGMGKSRDQ